MLAGLLCAWPSLGAPQGSPRNTPVVKAVSEVAPAVVNISAILVERRRATPFDLFFGEPGQQYSSENIGSGVIIDGQKALVLTNAHVVNNATSISIRLLDGRRFEAEIVGAEPDFDLAILRMKGATNLPAVKMGDSGDLMPGEPVIAIGNPFGFSHTVTCGVISAIDRTIQTSNATFTDLIQTDAAINPGNSGGPLLNILGELIGVNVAVDARAEGIGFAIPISKARRVVDEILDLGHVSQIWLALTGQDVDQRIARALGLPLATGLLITEIFDGPAKVAGLQAGDVILRLNGHEVQDRGIYLSLLRNNSPRQEITLEYFRDGRNLESRLTPTVFDDKITGDYARRRWGMTLKESRQGMQISAVQNNSPAHRLGLATGDYLTAIGGRRVNNAEDYLNAFRRQYLNQQVLLQVVRGNRIYNVRMDIH